MYLCYYEVAWDKDWGKDRGRLGLTWEGIWEVGCAFDIFHTFLECDTTFHFSRPGVKHSHATGEML